MPIFFNRSTTWALGLACSLAMLSLQVRPRSRSRSIAVSGLLEPLNWPESFSQGTPVTGSILNTKFGATSRSSDQALQKSVPQSQYSMHAHA